MRLEVLGFDDTIRVCVVSYINQFKEGSMRKTIASVLVGVVVLSSAGCASNKAGEGALIGGIIGAGAGAIIGNQGAHRNRDRTSGALIGGAAGALGGALVGSQMKKEQPSQQQAAPAQQEYNANQLSLPQIADLAKQGVNEDVIIDRIRLTNSKYNLNQGDIDYLQQNGVSPKVIAVMQSGQ